MKAILKCSELIKMINSMVPLETRMAIRLKLNDRKWSDVNTILRREKSRLLAEAERIESAIKILKAVKEE
jgi:hypothetical protein